MSNPQHHAIFTSDKSNKSHIAKQLLAGQVTGYFSCFSGLRGLLFSKEIMDLLIEEELTHDNLEVATDQQRPLISLSDGEQKKALLHYLLAQQPDFIILDNVFDNLDKLSQHSLLTMLQQVSTHTIIIQFVNRTRDLLPFINNSYILGADGELTKIDNTENYLKQRNEDSNFCFEGALPLPMHTYALPTGPLVVFNNVTIAYEERIIVKNIYWTIQPGESWQLTGPNGSGKTTLLTLITGDNPKAYGQDITLFGRKKGSGEAVWDIKKCIGYFTPAITSRFGRYDSLEKMVIGGFFDSIGLYIRPSDMQYKVARQWLQLIEMLHLKDVRFHKLSLGQQRTALIARAMIKHPPLLILDEPLSGLDDYNAGLVIAIINKIAAESNTTILYVSHRTEAGLQPDYVFELAADKTGSTGSVIT